MSRSCFSFEIGSWFSRFLGVHSQPQPPQSKEPVQKHQWSNMLWLLLKRKRRSRDRRKLFWIIFLSGQGGQDLAVDSSSQHTLRALAEDGLGDIFLNIHVSRDPPKLELLA